MDRLARRAFIGAGAAVATGAAVALFPTSLAGQGRGQGRGQARKDSAQLREFKKQFKAAHKKMRDTNDVGALVALLNFQAAVIDDNGLDAQIFAAAKKAGRSVTPSDHREMDATAEELGANEAGISVHVSPDPKFDGKAYESLMRGEGLAAKCRAAATFLETESKKWPKGGLVRAQIWSNGGESNYRDCPVCVSASGLAAERNYICGVSLTMQAMGVAGAASMCVTITGIWLTFESACQISRFAGC